MTTVYEAKAGGIYKNGEELHIRGFNWFGLETDYLGLHGLWSGRRIEDFLDQMKGLGFNAIRLPVSPEALSGATKGKDNYWSTHDQIDALLGCAEARGMYVLLDMHQCSCLLPSTNKPGPGLGACSDYTEARWISDLERLAGWSKVHENVLGIDLFNEPYGFKWADWAELAGRGGQAILKVNPNVLIFVEGVGGEGPQGGYGTFWGENLVDAGNHPPAIPKNRLVFSPHAYGPSVSGQEYFNGPDFPGNMPAIWDAHFGYLKDLGYTVCFGEWGGNYEGKDRVWQEAFVDYLNARGMTNFFYWSMNPNSGDTKGLLLDDWRTPNQQKILLIGKIQVHPGPRPSVDPHPDPEVNPPVEQAKALLLKGVTYPVVFEMLGSKISGTVTIG